MTTLLSAISKLNEPQQKAVQTVDGPVLVLAGPGSGKTRVLTHRIAYLIKERRIDPYNILAVTFTNKAAKELKERLTFLIGDDDTKRLTVGTFHSVCVKFLRTDIEKMGRRRDFTIYDQEDQDKLVAQTIKELDLDEKQYKASSIRSAISRAKNDLLTPRQFALQGENYKDEIVARCYERYEAKLQENNAVDFDDLLVLIVRLFQNYPDVLKKYQRRFHYVLIDEYQDVNACQYEFSKLISGFNDNLFVVGDEDQSVYAFRGADMRYVLQFEDDFPDAKVILLEQNYRSTQAILNVANVLMSRSTKPRHAKQLWTKNDKGVDVLLREAHSEDEEASMVLSEILRLRGKGEIEYKDCAVLYRTNAQSRVIEEAFVRHNINYRLIGGVRFYERKEIKDVLAYLRLISNPLDSVALFRVINIPARGIGDRTQSDLIDWAAELGLPVYTALQILDETVKSGIDDDNGLLHAKPPFNGRTSKALLGFLHTLNELIIAKDDQDLMSLLDYLLERIGFHDALIHEYDIEEGQTRWENVLELRTAASHYANFPREAQLTTYLEEIALVAATDDLANEQDVVTLITMHQAKGLEYPVVFVVGLEEGIMPHSRSLDDPEQLEEERRLLYVAATRAETRLYLFYANKRTMFGRSNNATPSRFILDMPPQVVTKLQEQSNRFNPSRISTSGSSRTWGSGSSNRSTTNRSATSWGAGSRKNTTPLRPAANAKYSAGMKVRHATFGEGIVVSSMPKSDDEEVTVAFVGQGIKKLSESIARLEIVKD